MEGNINMTSNASNSTAAAATAPHNHQQESKKAQTGQQAGGSGEPKLRPTQEVALCCPRCYSENTKFCYYNNYNLNQPRHFCKNCRRYWTQGGSLRPVPIGGGCRRNKRASFSSSSSAGVSSTAATGVKMENTFKTRLMLTAASTLSMPPSTTSLIPNDILPTFKPTGGSGGLDVAMEQQGFIPFAPLSDNQAAELAPGGGDMGLLPFAPLPLSDDQPLELAPGGSDRTPTFLDMLTGGYFGGLSIGGGSNGMDMSYLLPGMGASASDSMHMQPLEGLHDIAGELNWPSAELDSYFNNDGGYAAAPAAEVEQQQKQVAGEQQQEDNNKAKGAEG